MQKHKNLYKQIGAQIRARREDAGFTQEELGNRVNLTRTSITNLETGRQRSHVDKLFEIATVLGVTLSDLIPLAVEGEQVSILEDLLDDLPDGVHEWVNSTISIRSGSSTQNLEQLYSLRDETRFNRDSLLFHSWLFQAEVNQEIPIPVERIAKDLGIDVRYGPCEAEVAGALYQESRAVIIAVNTLQPVHRQRFAIAHALGHIILHNHTFHIDLNFPAVASWEEGAANAFAAHLLLPSFLLRGDLEQRSVDFEDTLAVRELAERYKVSTRVVEARLTDVTYFGESSAGTLLNE